MMNWNYIWIYYKPDFLQLNSKKPCLDDNAEASFDLEGYSSVTNCRKIRGVVVFHYIFYFYIEKWPWLVCQ